MGYILDDIIKKIVTENVTINTDYTGDVFSLGGTENGFGVVVEFDNGVAPVIEVSFEVSMDGTNFAPITNSEQTFSDTDGSVTYDILQSQAVFGRIAIAHTSGAVDIVRILLTAKRRH